MNEDIKEAVYFVIAVVTIIILIAGIIILANKTDENYEKRSRQLQEEIYQKQNQDIQECYNKTDDIDYCLKLFLK